MLRLRPLHLLLLLGLLPAAPGAAWAIGATISQNVNLRSGPSTDFTPVGELKPGETVDVSKCEGRFCYVSSGLGKGWVAAAYLTRDAVTPPVQAAAPQRPRVASTTALPPIPPPASQPRATLSPANPPPPAQFPPAYDEGDDLAALPNRDAPPRAVGGFALGDVPLPKADIPGGDDSFVAEDDPSLPDDAFSLPDRGGWGDYRRGDFRRFDRPRRDFVARAAVPPADSACFTDLDGGPGFCVRAGEQLQQPAQWADRIFDLSNPDGLDVTICTDAPFPDCQVHAGSGPLHLEVGRSIVSVSVAAIDGY